MKIAREKGQLIVGPDSPQLLKEIKSNQFRKRARATYINQPSNSVNARFVTSCDFLKSSLDGALTTKTGGDFARHRLR